jgi:hypothetical protein
MTPCDISIKRLFRGSGFGVHSASIVDDFSTSAK